MKGPVGKHAWTVKIGEKGQFVIPKEARALFGIEPGDTMLLLGDEKKGLAIVKGSALTRLFDELLGSEGGEAE